MTPSKDRPGLASCILAGAALTCLPALASAEETAKGVMTTSTATTGSTNVTSDAFETAKKADDKDATEAKVQAGLLIATGNSRSLAVTGSTSMRLRRAMNEFSAAAAINYARSAATPEDSMQTTMENYQGKLRYDRFVSERLSLFLSVSGRRDRFQGLAIRMNIDPGLAFYFIDEEKQRFWGELGYDFQYDVRRDDFIAAARINDSILLGKTKGRHSARGFLGYHTNVNEHVTFDTGAEILLGLPETENWRLNWANSLTAALNERFSLGASFNLRYDNNPLPGVKKLDTLTALNLICTLY